MLVRSYNFISCNLLAILLPALEQLLQTVAINPSVTELLAVGDLGQDRRLFSPTSLMEPVHEGLVLLVVILYIQKHCSLGNITIKPIGHDDKVSMVETLVLLPDCSKSLFPLGQRHDPLSCVKVIRCYSCCAATCSLAVSCTLHWEHRENQTVGKFFELHMSHQPHINFQNTQLITLSFLFVNLYPIFSIAVSQNSMTFNTKPSFQGL